MNTRELLIFCGIMLLIYSVVAYLVLRSLQSV
jgi:hypothetical protein